MGSLLMWNFLEKSLGPQGEFSKNVHVFLKILSNLNSLRIRFLQQSNHKDVDAPIVSY